MDSTGIILNSDDNQINILTPFIFIGNDTFDSDLYTIGIVGQNNNLSLYGQDVIYISSAYTTINGSNIELNSTRVYIPSMPMSDPMDGGVLWNDNGTVKISQG